MCRETLSNPAALERALDPANMRAMVQMQQAMQQLSGSGLMPGMPAPQGTCLTLMGLTLMVLAACVHVRPPAWCSDVCPHFRSAAADLLGHLSIPA